MIVATYDRANGRRGGKGLVDSQAHRPLGETGAPDDGTVVKTEGDGVTGAHHGVERVAVKIV